MDRFDEAYQGCWQSLAAWAEDIVADIGFDQLRQVPAWLQPYVRVDFERLGHDMATDYFVAEDADGVHIFG